MNFLVVAPEPVDPDECNGRDEIVLANEVSGTPEVAKSDQGPALREVGDG